jgi:ribosome-binding protein aMBF1 (putative translation factor)
MRVHGKDRGAVVYETPDDGEAPVIVSMAEAAMHMYSDAIESLPDSGDSEFPRRAEVILAGLRKLQSALSEAARRSRATPSVMVALSAVRSRYDDLMITAAAAPGSTLGQQLYVARRRAKLSAEETANGAGLESDLVDAIESGEIPTEDEAAKIKSLVAALGG